MAHKFERDTTFRLYYSRCRAAVCAERPRSEKESILFENIVFAHKKTVAGIECAGENIGKCQIDNKSTGMCGHSARQSVSI
jgi:hypothetical protein